MKKKVDFNLEGVTGQLTLEYGPFNQKLYQDGELLKRSKGKYLVKTTSGDTEEMKVVYGLDFVHVVTFRGRKFPLEERLSPLEYVLGGLPVLLIFIGGAIGAAIGIMGAIWTYDYFRTEKRTGMQIAVALGIAALCYVLYLAVAILFQLILSPTK